MATSDKKLVHVLRPTSDAIQFAAKPVIVKVGEPATVFHVDENRVSESSDFFKAALKKEWRSGQTRIVKLPEEDPACFNVYVNWLYSHLIFLDVKSGDALGNHSDTISLIIRAYTLADALIDIDFKDAISDAFVTSLELVEGITCYSPNDKHRTEIYEKTAPNCKLRQALVHHMSDFRNAEIVTEDDCTAFLVDLAKKQAEKDEDCVLIAATKCKFHEHAEGAEHCYRNKNAVTTFGPHGSHCPNCSRVQPGRPRGFNRFTPPQSRY